ncbi:MAG: ABC transporter ATP-binding protein, partial [Bacteroidetes bacterium]
MGYISMKKAPNILLSLKNISKSFRGEDCNLTVLDNFYLDIRKGEFISILGPSGCGKSTLLKICSSLLKQDSGKVSISGIDVDSPDRNRILMLQDDNQLFPWLTVKQNIAFSTKYTDSIRQESDLSNLLDMAGLGEYSWYYPHQLSGGMKKRTALVRALAGDPEILFMDEPFGSLDPKIKIKLQ